MVRFSPEHPGAIAVLDGAVVRSGDVVEAPAEWVARIGAAYVGVGGGPCLIPVSSPGVEAAADFIAAVSTPTPLNPETPPATVSVEASAKPEPVKRKPGRPRKTA